jgi:hypothetical protein
MFAALFGEIAILFVFFLLGAVWYKKKSDGTVSIYTELKDDVVSVFMWIKNTISGLKVNKPTDTTTSKDEDTTYTHK